MNADQFHPESSAGPHKVPVHDAWRLMLFAFIGVHQRSSAVK
jgi:hypothetical protein